MRWEFLAVHFHAKCNLMRSYFSKKNNLKNTESYAIVIDFTENLKYKTARNSVRDQIPTASNSEFPVGWLQILVFSHLSTDNTPLEDFFH